MIHVHKLRSPFSSLDRETTLVAHYRGVRIADVVPPELRDADFRDWRVVVNGKPTEQLLDAVGDGSHVTFLPRARDLVSIGTMILISAAINVALRILFPPPKPPKARGDEESPTYGFSGIQTNRSEGGAIGVVYGLHRYGGTIINEFTENRAFPPETHYNALVCYGEGDIQAFGNVVADTPLGTILSTSDPANPIPTGIQINGNAAETYQDVEVQVRLGTNQQNSIPGFEDANTQTAVGQTLTQVETTTAFNGPATVVYDSTNFDDPAITDPIFALHGRTQDLTTPVDAATAVIQFPQGLYGLDPDTGGLIERHFQLGARYVELDALNNPILSGGPQGDGYVRLLPEDFLVAKQNNPFAVEYRFPFFDPQVFVSPIPGEELILDGTNDYAVKTTPTLPSGLGTAGAEFTEFTLMAWVKLDEARDGNYIFSFAQDATSRGFRLRTKDVSGYVGGGTFHIPVFEFAGIPTFDTFESNPFLPGLFAPPTFVPPIGSWFFLACTYKRNYSGTNDRRRLYGNGALLAEVLLGGNLTSPGNTVGKILVGTADHLEGSTGASAKFKGQIDEVVWIQKELSAAEINSYYASGKGKYGTSAIPTLIAGWHFDVDGADFATGAANGLTLTNGAAVTTGQVGKIFIASGSALKRSKYRLQIVRVNKDSTNAQTIDLAEWESIIGHLDEAFSYPNLALLGVRVKASEQLNTSTPNITALVRGRKVPVWDQASTSNPTLVYQWSANPAWVALDMITAKRYGLGNLYDASQVDLVGLQAFADYCDNLIYDHHGARVAVTDWTDMSYVGSSGVGAITVFFSASAYLPLRQYLSIDDYLGFVGVNIVLSDINTPAGNRHNETLPTLPGGWRITAFDDALRTMTVSVIANADPWTTGTLLSSHVGGLGSVTGTVEGREFRFRFNGVFDTERGAWDALHVILGAGRGRPVREGNKLRVVYERPRDPIDAVSQSSIVEGSFEIDYGGNRNRANSLLVDFLDEDQNYDRSSAIVNHPSIQVVTSLETFRRESLFVEGVTSRRQIMADGLYQLNVNKEIVRQGTFRTGPDGLPYEPGDTVHLAHDLVSWGVSGRVAAAGTTLTIVLDRPVTLTSGAVEWEIGVRSSSLGDLSVARIDKSAIGSYPHTYTAGVTIPLQVAFPLSFTPGIGDPYIFVQQGTGREAQIVAVSREKSLETELRWVQYSDAVYVDNTFGDLVTTTASSLPAINDDGIPGPVERMALSQNHVTTIGGQHVLSISASWALDPATARIVSRTAIMLQRADAPYIKVAEVEARATSAAFLIPDPIFGETIRVAVQPIGFSGARARAEACTSLPLFAYPVGPVPPAPTALAATMNGERAMYSWTNASEDRSLSTELRRGGWILGQPIGVEPRRTNHHGPVANWGSRTTANSFGEKAPTVYARHASSAGMFSDYASIAFDADAAEAIALSNFQRKDQSWEDYGTGFDGTDVPDTQRDGLQITADLLGRKYLEFMSIVTAAEFVTSRGITTTGSLRMRPCYCECFVVGEQDHPYEIGDWPELEGVPFGRWTLEGPLLVLPGEVGNCTLEILIELDPDGAIDVLTPFTSGAVYVTYRPKYHVRLTRPSTGYNVRLYSIHSRTRAVGVTHRSRRQAQLVQAGRILARG